MDLCDRMVSIVVFIASLFYKLIMLRSVDAILYSIDPGTASRYRLPTYCVQLSRIVIQGKKHLSLMLTKRPYLPSLITGVQSR